MSKNTTNLVPSRAARLVFKLFSDSSRDLTVNKAAGILAGALSLGQVREAVEELVSHECLEEKVDPQTNLGACTYKRHPECDILTSEYKDGLI